MDMSALFTLALGLQAPWKVAGLTFDQTASRLDLRVDFAAGSTFPCPECQAASKVHDTAEKTWRHLNFFQHQTYLSARQPRVDCASHGVKLVAVPWARPGSGFTLMFEAFVLLLAQNMPMAAVARVVREHDTRLWRIVKHHVEDGLSRLDLSGVRRVGLDETSRARGHDYLTLFVDADAARVIGIVLDRSAEVVAEFKEWFVERGGDPERVTDFSLDMSPAYIKGVAESFPKAKQTFDKFHVIKLANDAVDEVRREEQRTLKAPELKKTRFLFLRNEKNLSEAQKERLDAARAVARKTSRAYFHRETLQELYRQPDATAAAAFFKRWHRGASRCRLKPVRRVAKTLKDHLAGLLRWFDSRVTNALLEGFSSLVQAAKAAARGYRNANYMALMIYLRLGKLDLRLPDLASGQSI
jgi:transposase